MDDISKHKLKHRKTALASLSQTDRAKVDEAILSAEKRLKYIGRDGATELVAALGEFLATHNVVRK